MLGRGLDRGVWWGLDRGDCWGLGRGVEEEEVVGVEGMSGVE